MALINESDKVLISTALSYWANYIETGIPTLSIKDVIQMKQQDKIKPLELDQQKFVIRLRELALKELKR